MSIVHKLQVPDFGDTDQIELISWHVQAGETISQGQEICDFSTDKAVFTMDSPANGKIGEIFVKAPSQVETGQEVCSFIPSA